MGAPKTTGIENSGPLPTVSTVWSWMVTGSPPAVAANLLPQPFVLRARQRIDFVNLWADQAAMASNLTKLVKQFTGRQTGGLARTTVCGVNKYVSFIPSFDEKHEDLLHWCWLRWWPHHGDDC